MKCSGETSGDSKFIQLELSFYSVERLRWQESGVVLLELALQMLEVNEDCPSPFLSTEKMRRELVEDYPGSNEEFWSGLAVK